MRVRRKKCLDHTTGRRRYQYQYPSSSGPAWFLPGKVRPSSNCAMRLCPPASPSGQCNNTACTCLSDCTVAVPFNIDVCGAWRFDGSVFACCGACSWIELESKSEMSWYSSIAVQPTSPHSVPTSRICLCLCLCQGQRRIFCRTSCNCSE
ncbi:hypothetical protein VFPPC_18707 [Pochonia chlamydosporia 170]|uniref:Uncharacterized protein n=1 Tax=Pochonia chlamydosporia 170 TaxID=1380566 RepID=A0A219AS18_METCM|nr:hypothetical protein VFPPC_18707 [Pochonia chlamydosporia 170]OWT43566.1 hypothetical protein VFPPC_18707 [Pochonia chlamydosporia 170]